MLKQFNTQFVWADMWQVLKCNGRIDVSLLQLQENQPLKIECEYLRQPIFFHILRLVCISHSYIVCKQIRIERKYIKTDLFLRWSRWLLHLWVSRTYYNYYPFIKHNETLGNWHTKLPLCVKICKVCCTFVKKITKIVQNF